MKYELVIFIEGQVLNLLLKSKIKYDLFFAKQDLVLVETSDS